MPAEGADVPTPKVQGDYLTFLLFGNADVCSFHDLHFQVKDERQELLEDEVEYDQCPMAENLQEQLR